MILLVCLWGVNFAVIKFTLRWFDPLAFSVARFAFAATVLSAIVIARRRRSTTPLHGAAVAAMTSRTSSEHRSRRSAIASGRETSPRLIGEVVLLGLVGHTLYQVLFIYGLRSTKTTHSALILALVPVFVAIISRVAGHERLRSAAWLGVFVSLGGLAALVVGGPSEGEATLTGDLMTLGAAFAWAIYTVRGRPLLEVYSPLHLTTATMYAGAVGLLVLGWDEVLNQPWTEVPSVGWLGFVYATLGGLVIAYVIWYTGVRRLGSTRTAVFSNLVPVVALLVGVLVLDEQLAAMQVGGAAAVMLGVLMTRRTN